MISVERVVEYTHMETEAPLKMIGDNKVDVDWPKNGEITATNINLKYKNNDTLVLNNLNFTINAREKVF